jgi:hypothetical protein
LPASRRLTRDEALSELTRRYFTSHGPATLKDFAWWSGLPAVDAARGLDSVRWALDSDEMDGVTYWCSASAPTARSSRAAYLLPAYDEYLIAYRDRTAPLHPGSRQQGTQAPFTSTIVMGGRIIGTWARTVRRNFVVLKLEPFGRIRRAEKQAVVRAARHYGAFLGRPMMVKT